MPPVTSPRPGLGDIIGRLQSATGPDREIDAALWLACVEKPEPGDKLDRDMIGRWPSYTASIDSAMTLVPEGHVWTMSSGHWIDGPDGYDAFGAECATFIQTADYPEVMARSPALALCIAALRARQPAS